MDPNTFIFSLKLFLVKFFLLRLCDDVKYSLDVRRFNDVDAVAMAIVCLYTVVHLKVNIIITNNFGKHIELITLCHSSQLLY